MIDMSVVEVESKSTSKKRIPSPLIGVKAFRMSVSLSDVRFHTSPMLLTVIPSYGKRVTAVLRSEKNVASAARNDSSTQD